MTTMTAPPGRRSITGRIARWALDFDGDMYGDERERLHWYEGIATAAGLQWMAVPWAGAVMVWVGGRQAVVPLTVVLVALYLPMLLCLTYVSRRRVDTAARSWPLKRIVVTTLYGLPYPVFMAGALKPYSTDGDLIRGAGVGALVGGVLAVAVLAIQTRRRRRREAMALPDAD
ncbi:hypothetical protein [Krasilnikovia sp. MM14-A1259]|uniref:hypothetical protein n=1 Tax=Krasilnikovia sp. MM14-A1259 TaxID=3373539 RepID=UPI00381DDFAA